MARRKENSIGSGVRHDGLGGTFFVLDATQDDMGDGTFQNANSLEQRGLDPTIRTTGPYDNGDNYGLD